MYSLKLGNVHQWRRPVGVAHLSLCLFSAVFYLSVIYIIIHLYV